MWRSETGAGGRGHEPRNGQLHVEISQARHNGLDCTRRHMGRVSGKRRASLINISVWPQRDKGALGRQLSH